MYFFFFADDATGFETYIFSTWKSLEVSSEGNSKKLGFVLRFKAERKHGDMLYRKKRIFKLHQGTIICTVVLRNGQLIKGEEEFGFCAMCILFLLCRDISVFSSAAFKSTKTK